MISWLLLFPSLLVLLLMNPPAVTADAAAAVLLMDYNYADAVDDEPSSSYWKAHEMQQQQQQRKVNYYKDTMRHRHMQEDSNSNANNEVLIRPCNEKITTVTTEELQGVVDVYLTSIFSQQDDSDTSEFLLEAGRMQVAATIQYDFDVWKLCGSCTSVTPFVVDDKNTIDDTSTFANFGSYCGPDFYGYNAEHSFLVMIPKDDSSSLAEEEKKTLPPLSGYLSGFVQMHQTESTASRAPTQVFPSSVALELQKLQDSNFTDTDLLIDFTVNIFLETVTPMLATSAGAVGIVPDYLGYGETFLTHNRTYFYHESYMQSAVVSWLTTQAFLQNDLSNGCSILENRLAIAGASEGSFATIAAAAAFRRLGISVLSAFPSAPIFDAETTIATTIEAYDSASVTPDDDLFFVSRVGFPFSVFVSSIDIPGLANSFTGQRTVNPEWNIPGNKSRNVISWFASPNPVSGLEIARDLAPLYVPEVLEPSLLELFQLAANMSSPCSSNFVAEGVNDKTCEYILNSTVIDLILEADYNVVICASPNDTVATTRQTPDSLYQNNPFVQAFSGFLGISITGDHFEVTIGCLVAPVLALVDTSSETSLGTIISEVRPLEASDVAVCQGDTVVPAEMPTVAPTMGEGDGSSSGGMILSVHVLPTVLFGLFTSAQALY